MNIPHWNELTKTENVVYDLISDPWFELTSTRGIATTLKLDEGIVAGVCDGLEAMGFVQRYGGLWHPDYTES